MERRECADLGLDLGLDREGEGSRGFASNAVSLPRAMFSCWIRMVFATRFLKVGMIRAISGSVARLFRNAWWMPCEFHSSTPARTYSLRYS